jgi:hypothetical protein
MKFSTLFLCLFLTAPVMAGVTTTSADLPHALNEYGMGGSAMGAGIIDAEIYARRHEWKLGSGKFAIHAKLSPQWTLNGGYLQLPVTSTSLAVSRPVMPLPSQVFSDLSATYSHELAQGQAWFVKAQMQAAPSFGPMTSLRGFPGMQGAMHLISPGRLGSGAVSTGYRTDKLRFVASAFNYQDSLLQLDTLNSRTARVSFNPTSSLALQASHGWLSAQTPVHDQFQRSSVSALYRGDIEGRRLESMLAWGQKSETPMGSAEVYLWNTTLELQPAHALFGRFERLRQESIAHGSGQPEVSLVTSKAGLGYEYSRSLWDRVTLGMGVMQQVELASNHEDEQLAFFRLALN